MEWFQHKLKSAVQGLLYTLSPEKDLNHYRELEQKVLQSAPDFDGPLEDPEDDMPDILDSLNSYHYRNKYGLLCSF